MSGALGESGYGDLRMRKLRKQARRKISGGACMEAVICTGVT